MDKNTTPAPPNRDGWFMVLLIAALVLMYYDNRATERHEELLAAIKSPCGVYEVK